MRGEGQRRGGYGGKRHGKVRATAQSGLSAVGQLSAPLSSPGFVSDTIYLAVKTRQATRSPPPPPRHPHLRPPLTDSITNCHHPPPLASLWFHSAVRLSGQASERHLFGIVLTRKTYLCYFVVPEICGQCFLMVIFNLKKENILTNRK